jgi:ferredoxin-NADP reductase
MSTLGADTTSKKAAWPIFMAKLQSRQEVAEGTMAFCFEKPAGWTFVAGQFIDLTLIAPPETDAEGNTRGFSIASAPFEATIMIATRLRDTAFKRVLKTLPLGTEVKIEGPFGDLRLRRNEVQPAVVLSGGIGITPFRSILLQAAHENRSRRIFFFYGNRRPEDAPFLAEMRALERENAHFGG